MTNLSSEDKWEALVKTIEVTLRATAIANAAGAIATMTFVGTTAKNGNIENILALPLGLFCAGAVCSLLNGYRMMLLLVKASTGKEPPVDRGFIWTIPFLNKFEDFFFFGSVGLFTIGVIAGVAIVAFA